MMRRIKMIWDFRGPEAKKIAEHHEIHLKDYIKMEGIEQTITAVETLSDMYSIAYMVVDEKDMLPIREALKPHRGQVYAE